ncbi:uncharacterized protein LOC125376199 [Haliotis rufescens]|uniref:uncharacterized protein LOC125376199 n=1 Tax=Haliotis rufescens TaxID=6454 RepID=UPI00201E7B2D|nr:uncharacterized protein LOC125376199 [Haliotis rufescens]
MGTYSTSASCMMPSRIYVITSANTNRQIRNYRRYVNRRSNSMQRKTVSVESYIQSTTNVYHRHVLLQEIHSVVKEDSTLAKGDSGRRSSESHQAPNETFGGTITTPNPHLDAYVPGKYGILRDCSDVKKQHPDALNGVYSINPDTTIPFSVYCDMTTSGLAWTVIQKRRDGSVRFNRTSAEYTDGFGDLKTEFWLGDSFRDADGEQFSTEDDDRDDKLFDNCAKKYFGGWWYNACGGSCLNGLYTASNGRGIFWRDWRGEPIKVTEMKIRSLERVKDCVGLPKNKGGAYMVNPDDLHPFPAYCDTTTEDGNWLVIQRRRSGTVNFYRTWSDYARGFGDTEGEFWIGNNVLNRLTKSGNTMLRIDLEDPAGEKWYAIYRHFKVASEAEYFKLSIGNYSGNAGDNLRYHAGREFSTKDRDQDRHLLVNCAVKHTGAWWYNACHKSNLNGQYNITVNGQGIAWAGLKLPLTFTEMKIRQ